MSRRPSLLLRLLWLVGIPVIVLWLLAGGWLTLRAAHETNEMFDRELQRTAASVLVVMAAGPERVVAPHDIKKLLKHAERRPEIVVRNRRNEVLVDASSLPVLSYDGDRPRFENVEHDHQRWRIYQRWDDGHRYWVQVGVPLHDREQLMGAAVEALVVPLIGLVLLLPLAIWLGLRTGLAPLRSVSRAIAARPARTPALTGRRVPRELVQLTRTVDALVVGINDTLQRERRFTADAAHELRHPLSVLRMELDLARVATDDDARRVHLGRARDGLARMERLVAQLLTLARVESLDGLDGVAEVDVAALAAEVVADAGERAAPRNVELSLDVEGSCRVDAVRGLLEIALRDLVDNAIHHGRRGGRVNVAVGARRGVVEAAVTDDGPGMPPEVAARVGQRFARGAASAGSGLGLSIVQAIARLHGGRLAMQGAPGGGTRALLSIPARR
ncbi:MAG TPA: ATP-binding protein [Nevskiaceae bacterium]